MKKKKKEKKEKEKERKKERLIRMTTDQIREQLVIEGRKTPLIDRQESIQQNESQQTNGIQQTKGSQQTKEVNKRNGIPTRKKELVFESSFSRKLLSEAANLDVFFFLDFGHFLVLLET